jgi:chromate transporter
VSFRRLTPVPGYGLEFDMPVFAKMDPWALALALAAIVAILRFKVGMIPTLLACTAAGLVLHLTGFVS